MSKFKKLLISILAIATLSSVAIIPMSANAIYVGKDGITYNDEFSYYEQNAVKEAVIILEDAGKYSGTYYFGVVNYIKPSISLDSFTDDEIYTLNSGLPVKIDDTIDTSAVETVMTFKYGKDDIYIPIDMGYAYTNIGFSTEMGSWFKQETTIEKPTTVGDSDQTIGDSKVTALRGDVNLDGDVNGLDLLYLKKYLLGLIEW